MTSDTGSPKVNAIDVIVATRNRPDDLARLIPTLRAQSVREFRLLLVDQSDDPRANLELIENARDDRLTHVAQRAKGKSKALNLALRRTSAPIIAFTDDDCTLPEDWLHRALAALENRPAVGMVFGNLVPTEHDGSSWFIPSIEFERSRVIRGPLLKSHGLLGMGANMIVRRSLFDAIGMFDEDLGPGGMLITGEECELTYRALKSGFDVAQEPELSVIHWGARPIAGNVAKDLINIGVFAVGAGYGKHVRSGDWRAVSVSAYEAGWYVTMFARSLIDRKPPFHIRRIGLFWKGLFAGFRRGPRVPFASSPLDGAGNDV